MAGKFFVESGFPLPDAAKPNGWPSPLPGEGAEAVTKTLFTREEGRHGLAPEKLVAEPVNLPAKYARAKLNTAYEIADEIARVYRLAKSGRMDASIATKLTYILATMAKVRSDGELERRIEALETRRIN